MEARVPIQACHTTAMRFEFENERGDELAVSNINFYGPQPSAAAGRRDISADEIVRSNDRKSQTGPFGDMSLEVGDL